MEAPVKKRRRIGVVGTDENRIRLATLLMRTWQVELERYLSIGNNKDDVDVVASPDDVIKHLSDTPAARKARRIDNITENVELNPPGRRTVNDRSTSLWLKVAALVIAKQFDPERFIRRQFAVRSPQMPTVRFQDRPQPQMLLSPQAIKNYHAGHGVSVTEIQAAFRSQVATFKRRVATLGQSRFYTLDSEGTWLKVLTNTELSLSALFRYCMARSILKQDNLKQRDRFKQVASEYRTAAAIQYVFEADEYDEIWRDYLPKGWSEKAQRIYRSYYGFNHE